MRPDVLLRVRTALRQGGRVVLLIDFIDDHDEEIMGWDRMSVGLREEAIAKTPGYSRPYDDWNHDGDDRDPTLKITERNYANVQARIVNNTHDYRGMIGNGFPDTQIMTPGGHSMRSARWPKSTHRRPGPLAPTTPRHTA